MAAPEITAIADGVVAVLNGHTFDAPYNSPANIGAVRKYVPVYTLKEQGQLVVTVVPNGETAYVITRGRQRAVDYRIDVGVQKRVPGLVTQDIDDLTRFTEQVMDLLITNDLTGLAIPRGQAIPTAVALDPVWDPHHLDEMQQFTAVVTVTYRSYR